jgi:LPXTG-motif cell wall-anchored protein
VAPPPVPQPVSSLPPVPPATVAVPTALPVGAPDAQGSATAQVSTGQLPPGVQGTSGAGGTPELAAGLPTGGVAVSGSIADPSAALAVDTAQARYRMGERDYSSSGSPASSSGSGGAGTAATDPALQDPSPVATVCPQLAFAPMISGCQLVLGPLSGPLSRLAHTGTPIALALAGLVFIVLGAIIFRRSRRQPPGGPSRRLRGVPTR